MWLTITQDLVDRILDDSAWSDGDELKRLANEYWHARWEDPPNMEKARQIVAQMDEIKPERTKIEPGVYRVNYCYSDGALFQLGPEWREVESEGSYYSKWASKWGTVEYCEGDVILDTRR